MKFPLITLLGLSLTPLASSAVVSGSLDFGTDDGWTPVGATPAQGSNLAVGSSTLTYSHAATGSTMVITSTTAVAAGNGWRTPQIDFTASQVRSDWNLPDQNSVGSDLQFITVEISFGSGVGDNGLIPFDAFDNINWSSQNGSSEAYEWGIVQLNGGAFGSNLDAANLSTYTNTLYNSGVTIGQHANEGLGVYSADGLNTTITPGDPDPAAGTADTTDPVTATEFAGVPANYGISGFTWYAGVVDVTDAVNPDSGFSETGSLPSAGLNSIDWNDSMTSIVVPEPSSLLLSGLSFLALARRRRS